MVADLRAREDEEDEADGADTGGRWGLHCGTNRVVKKRVEGGAGKMV